ncbi:O-antigen ligase family protein [Candidatus Pelagibacter sp.]|nr:O-antigen ligase family protein [Candidatus Pelagibacter sp.]
MNVFFEPTKYGARITSFFYDEKILGSYLSRMFPLYLALSITQIKNFSSNFLSILTILLLFIGTFISGERAALFFLMISTFIIFIYFNGFTKIRIIFASFIIVTLTFIFLTNTALKNRMITETFNSIFKEKEKIIIFTQEHDSHIRTALKIFSDSPLLGHGPRMFRIKCQIEEFQVGNTPCNTHPHNFYIQLLAETGILGFSFLFFLLIFSIYRSIKQLYHKFYSSEVFEKYSNFKISLISGIMATIFPLTTNGNFFNNYLMIIYFLPLGFLFYSFNENNDDRI